MLALAIMMFSMLYYSVSFLGVLAGFGSALDWSFINKTQISLVELLP